MPGAGGGPVSTVPILEIFLLLNTCSLRDALGGGFTSVSSWLREGGSGAAGMVFAPSSHGDPGGNTHILLGMGGEAPPAVGRRRKALDGAKAPALLSSLAAGISDLHLGKGRSCPGVLD